MPITFGAGNGGKEKKQEQIERVYELPVIEGEGTERWLKITEQTSFDLDKVGSLFTHSHQVLTPLGK
jgi:hypothetical protein